ncbi:bacteriocin-protection, YdeI or OmpD-associated-domain-containing protein [Xylariaceae sp. FL0016]|nr:bacteriocin-protection, YdeI or OmpD-associated-domain-containing protein [Xylariaceae sp. FL0016]
MPVDLPALTIPIPTTWTAWLAQHAATSPGVWLTLAKKGTTAAPRSLTYAQALDAALCHGWVDSQARAGDAHVYAQRFTPRGARSLWSARNVAHVARLERQGRMTSAVRAAVDAARRDGRWEAAYKGQATAEPPGEFLEALEKVPRARQTWEGLNRGRRYEIIFKLNALRTPAGRERRIRAFVEMLAEESVGVPGKKGAKRKERSGN